MIRNGTLYGTTALGGHGGKGTVFSISKSGKEEILYEFKGGNDGESPQAGLVDIKGTLYGTTSVGGTAGRGRSSNSVREVRSTDGRRAAVGLCDLHSERNADARNVVERIGRVVRAAASGVRALPQVVAFRHVDEV